MSTRADPRLPATLLGVARRATDDPDLAEDLLQELHLVLLGKARHHSTDRVRWSVGVVRNRARREWRSRRRRHVRERRYAHMARLRVVDDPAEVLAREELRSVVREALTNLPAPYRLVLQMRFFDGLQTAEIAKTLGIGTRAAESRLRRAKARLRAGLLRSTDLDRQGVSIAAAPAFYARGLEAVGDSLSSAELIRTRLMEALAVATSVKTTLGCAALAMAAGWFAHAWIPTEAGGGDASRDESRRDVLASGTAAGTAEARRGPGLRLATREPESTAEACLRREIEDLREQLTAARRELARATDTGGEHDDVGLNATDPLGAVDWRRLGIDVADIASTASRRFSGERPSPEARKRMVVGYKRYYDVAQEISQAGWPSSTSTAGDVLAHPTFIARLIEATLAAAQVPLTAEQAETLEEIRSASAERIARNEASRRDDMLAIERLADRVLELRTFYGLLDPTLTNDQHDALHPASIRGRLDADNFCADAAWRVDVQQIMASEARMAEALAIRLRLSIRGLTPQLAEVVSERFVTETTDATKAILGRAGDAERMDVYASIYNQPDLFVRATIQLYRSIIDAAAEDVADAARQARGLIMPMPIVTSEAGESAR